MRSLITALLIALACAASVLAQSNTVVFDNQSGEPALVKLVGPTSAEIEVGTGSKGTVTAAAGHYTIKVRYGAPGNFRYTKGEEFEVTETPTARSETTITLHKVVGGNYASQASTQSEFEAEPQHSGGHAGVRSGTREEVAVGKPDSQGTDALTGKSTLVVIHSGEVEGYVFVSGGAPGAGGDGALRLYNNKTGASLGGVAPAGDSYWAFASKSVRSVTGRTITFVDGARVVVGHTKDQPAIQEVARKLLQLGDGDGAFRTDCSSFSHGCLNGVVGTVGSSLKWVEAKTGVPGKLVRTVEMKDVVLTSACGDYPHWSCPK